MEFITGLTLAASAGLNAYIPLLGLGLLARFTDVLVLPPAWGWLQFDVSLWVLGALLLCELIVDKVPALDTVNDVLQTLVRPASGGIVFSAGSASATLHTDDAVAFVSGIDLWPFVLGVAIALVPHILKAVARPVLNLMSAGAAAAVTSWAEDLGAALLTVLAILAPLLALLVLAALVWLTIIAYRRVRAARASRRASTAT